MRWSAPALLASLLAVSTCLPFCTNARPADPLPGREDFSEPDYVNEVRSLLKTYCFECHNTTKRKAGLDLEEIDTATAALDRVELWDQVGERVRAMEMPPAKSKQPTEDERRLLFAWVKHAADSRVNYDKLPKEQLEEVPPVDENEHDGARLGRLFREPQEHREELSEFLFRLLAAGHCEVWMAVPA